MSQLDKRVPRIVRDLHPRTDKQEIRWTVGRRSDQFIYSSSGASVIVETVDSDHQAPYRLRITNDNGDVVAQVGPDDEFPQEELQALYELVERRTLYVDETLDSLLADLESGDS